MTREEILKEYKVEDGRIVSPGKFENEPIYSPYYYDLLLNGMEDALTEDGDAIFDVTPEDRIAFPELAEIETIGLAVSDDGFVYCADGV